MRKMFGGFDINLPYEFKVIGLVKREINNGVWHFAALIVDDMGYMRWYWCGRDLATAVRITITGRTTQKVNGTYCVKGKAEWANDEMVYGADEEHVGDCWLILTNFYGQQFGAAIAYENGDYALENPR